MIIREEFQQLLVRNPPQFRFGIRSDLQCRVQEGVDELGVLLAWRETPNLLSGMVGSVQHELLVQPLLDIAVPGQAGSIGLHAPRQGGEVPCISKSDRSELSILTHTQSKRRAWFPTMKVGTYFSLV